MPAIPVLKPRQVIRSFETLGWEVSRQKGSHIILVKAGQTATLSVPNHPTVARGTLRSLIKNAGVTIDEFVAATKK